MVLWPIGCSLRETAVPPALERKDGIKGMLFCLSKAEGIPFLVATRQEDFIFCKCEMNCMKENIWQILMLSGSQ